MDKSLFFIIFASNKKLSFYRNLRCDKINMKEFRYLPSSKPAGLTKHNEKLQLIEILPYETEIQHKESVRLERGMHLQ